MISTTQKAAALAGADENRTLTESAYAALRRDIISGNLPPDEKLRIERLKQQYGIGPTPLREALQRLAADGLVVAIGNRGFTVAPLDAEELRDLNTARTALEVQAVRLSIENGDADWEASVVGAAYRLSASDALLRTNDNDVLDDWAQANAAFHLSTVAACGSQWLLRMRDTLNAQYERYRRASVTVQRQDRELAFEHQGILDAVLARDADTACKLVAEHFNATTRTLIGERSG